MRNIEHEEACRFVHKLNLKDWAGWKDYVKNGILGFPNLPLDIPENPQYIYRDKGWIDISNWVGLESMDSKKTNLWDEVIVFLKNFRHKNGHFKLPNEESYEEINIWLEKVRNQKRKGLLNPKLEEKLNSINYDWSN